MSGKEILVAHVEEVVAPSLLDADTIIVRRRLQ
jgi:hypothetical protein